MREICTSGSTRDGASNPPSTLPAPFRAFTLMNDELASRNLRNTRLDVPIRWTVHFQPLDRARAPAEMQRKRE